MQQQQHARRSAMPQPLADVLAETRTQFIDGLIPIVNEIEFQRQAMADPKRAAEAFAVLRRISHRISGLAGTVGFLALGEKAAEMDSAFCRLLRASYDPKMVGAIELSLEQFLDLMEDALDADL